MVLLVAITQERLLTNISKSFADCVVGALRDFIPSGTGWKDEESSLALY